MADRIALIDFCETLADFQTLIPYLEYVIRQKNACRSRVLNSNVVKKGCALMSLIMHAFGWKYPIYKQILVWQLRGLKRGQLEEYGKKYYEERVRGHLITPTLEFILQLKKQGYRLMIVSGGSEFYIHWFAQEYGIDDVLSARFGYEDGICSGKLLHECMGHEKTEMIREYMQVHSITGEFEVGVSDSQSDLPMLGLCRQKVIVSHGGHQRWVTENMDEIIWN